MEISKSETATEIPTAVEVALNKVPYDTSPSTTKLFNALRKGDHNLPDEIRLNGKVVPFTAQTIAAFGFNSGNLICSDEDLAKLRDAQAEMEAVLKTFEKYSFSNIHDHMNQKRDEMQAAMLRGEDVSGITLEDRDAVNHTFRQKQSALSSMLVKTTHEKVVPLVKPIHAKFVENLESWMRGAEEGDRECCEAYGLEFDPSLLWKASASIAAFYVGGRKLPGFQLWSTPRVLLAGIIEL